MDHQDNAPNHAFIEQERNVLRRWRLPSPPLHYHSERLGCLIRGSNATLPRNLTVESELQPGLLAIVNLRGNPHFGPVDKPAIKAHTGTVIVVAVCEPTRWIAHTGHLASQSVGIGFDRDALNKSHLGPAFENLFRGREAIRVARRSTLLRDVLRAQEMLDIHETDPLRPFLLETYASEFIVDGIKMMSGRNTPYGDPHRVRIMELCDRIELDLLRNWTLLDLAREAGISKRGLNDIFRREIGMSPFAYIRSRRLLRARDALLAGETVTRAAALAGYRSPANFSTAFLRAYHMAPSALRAADRPALLDYARPQMDCAKSQRPGP